MLQQAAGLAAATNPALLPILQNLQQSAALTMANQGPTGPAGGGGGVGGGANNEFTQQLAAAAMMLPNHLNAQQQLTAALLNSQASAVAQAPLIAASKAPVLVGYIDLTLSLQMQYLLPAIIIFNYLQIYFLLLYLMHLHQTSYLVSLSCYFKILLLLLLLLSSSDFGAQLSAANTNPIGHKQSLRTVASPEALVSPPQLQGEDTTKKREIRLMKNR